MTRAPAMLALVTDAFGGRGGIAQYNRDFLGALAETGAVSSILVLPRHAPDRIAAPAGISQADPRPSRILYAIAAVRAVLRRPVDIVFCGHLYMSPLAALIARFKRAKLVVQMHGIEAWHRPSWLRRAAVESADLVLCVSRFTRARVLSWAAIAPERVLVLPNTVGETFTLGDGSILRETWGLQGKRVLLTVGRIDGRERYKGHDRVIAAIPKLISEGDDVIYVVLGEGDDRARLDAVAVKAGVADRVRFMGATASETLVEVYRMADLFVMPSTGEGFGIAFLEAMASGTPALGLAVAGATDALADGELGEVVAEAELSCALVRALGNPNPDRQAIAAAVRARFGRSSFTSRARAALHRLCEDARASVRVEKKRA
jgi:phosphatidylinositol alpha-1,6-mannosyltransferase